MCGRDMGVRIRRDVRDESGGTDEMCGIGAEMEREPLDPPDPFCGVQCGVIAPLLPPFTIPPFP